MSGLSLVVNNDTEQEEQGREYVKADTDNGYYRVANELALALCKTHLNDTQGRLLEAVKVKTFGFNKSMDWVCNAQLSELTGIAENHIATIKTSLFARKILIKEGRKIGINPVVSEWIKDPKLLKQGVIKTPKVRSNNSVGTSAKLRKQGVITPKVRNHNRQDTNTKDNITKDSKPSLNLPSWLPSDIWSEFVAMRKSIKKPLTEQAIVRMINKLVKFHEKGIDAVAQLTYSIDNCYSDVYEPKGFQNNSFRSKSIPENFDNKDYGETQIPVWMQGAES
jgi:phage replication O-like protein O